MSNQLTAEQLKNALWDSLTAVKSGQMRSEERRVGKECSG